MADSTFDRLAIEMDASPLVAGAQAFDGLSAAALRFIPALDAAQSSGANMAQTLADLGRTFSTTGPQAGQNAQIMAELTRYYAATGQAAQTAAAGVQQAGQAAQQAASATQALAQSQAQAGAAVQTASQAIASLGASQQATGQAGQQAAAGLGRLSAAIVEVASGSRALNAAFAQFEPLAVQQQRIVQALAAGYISAETAAQAWVLAERGAAEASRGFGAGVGGGFASLGQRNFAITNASEQLRQFIEQISFGTPAIQAFAQQAPQALVGFGPWAAILGVAAAAIGGLISALPGLISGTADAAKAAKDQQQATTDLLKALDATATGVAGFKASLAGLSAEQRSLVAADVTAELHTQSAAFDEAAKKAADYAKGLGTGGFSAIVRNIAPSEFAVPSQQDLDALKAFGDASSDLENRVQALQAGVGTFDDVSAAIRRMGDAQREGGDATAKQRVEIEQQIDKLAVLAGGVEAARQAQFLHTAQVHEFLAAMGQSGAITAFDEQILNQAEVAKAATAALQQLDRAHQAVVAGQVADRIRASGIPNAGQEADDFLTRELAKGPAEQFKNTQETRQAEATIVFKGDTTQAQQALDLLKKAALDAGATFEQQEQGIRALGERIGAPFPVIQAAIGAARLEADKLIASQRQAADVQVLVQAGFEPGKAQQQASAIAAGNQGLDQRAQAVRAIADAERARDAFAARGPAFAREQAAATQEVTQLQGKLRDIDDQRAKTAASQAEAMLRQREAALAQLGPAGQLEAAELRINDERRKGLLTVQEVGQRQVEAGAKYADAIAQQAAKQAAGLSERDRLQAEINAELDAERQHGEARVGIDQKVLELRSQLAAVDAKEQDALQKQNDTIDAGIAKQRTQLAQLQARGGGSTALAIQEARQAAEESVPQLTNAEIAAPGGAAAFVDRLAVQRDKADRAEQIVLQQQYNSVLRQVQTPLQAYADELSKLDDLQARGKLTGDEYARAVVGIVTPEQQFGEATARTAAQLVQIDLLYDRGNISLERRTQLLQANTAQQGANAAAARQAAIQQNLNIGEPGSGAGIGQQAIAGLTAGALQIEESYGNASKAIATGLTGAFSQASDALTTFLTTGKADFRGLVTSILHDLIQLAIEYSIVAAFRAAAGIGGGVSSTGTITASGSGMATSVTSFLQGGMVGEAAPSRVLSPMLFANAPRAQGGIDLSAGEVPIIAHRGERVLNPAETAAYNRGGGGTTSVSMTINVDARGGTDPGALEEAARRGAQLGAAQALSTLDRNPAARSRLATGR